MCQLGCEAGKSSERMELEGGDDREAKEGGNETSSSFCPDINQMFALRRPNKNMLM